MKPQCVTDWETEAAMLKQRRTWPNTWAWLPHLHVTILTSGTFSSQPSNLAREHSKKNINHCSTKRSQLCLRGGSTLTTVMMPMMMMMLLVKCAFPDVCVPLQFSRCETHSSNTTRWILSLWLEQLTLKYTGWVHTHPHRHASHIQYEAVNCPTADPVKCSNVCVSRPDTHWFLCDGRRRALLAAVILILLHVYS